MEGATVKHLVVNKADIAYLQFLLEGYEGLCTLTTLDPGRALVGIFIPLDLRAEAEGLLKAIAGEIPLEETALGSGPLERESTIPRGGIPPVGNIKKEGSEDAFAHPHLDPEGIPEK